MEQIHSAARLHVPIASYQRKNSLPLNAVFLSERRVVQKTTTSS
ncbi:hypothetical protein [Pontibacillus halophilus]|nr:hypothetical protein [Pontibacillus halophilus]